MVVTRHTRTTKILRELSNAQREDWALEPSLIPTIRYHLLHNFKQCFQVTLKSHDPPDPRTGALTLRNFTPFLASQAEVQNITDGDSLWKQVVPILDFIRQNLEPQTSSRKSRGYPTLFRWFCLESHRSYLFFAFIGVIMARPNSTRIYSARELLDMRHVDHVDLCEDLLNMLKNKLELGDIIRPPLGRKLTRIPEETREASGDSEEHLPPKRVAPRQLDGTDSDWKYRGRSESEDAQAQPISAPSGLTAQKDEGFQRFYRAVVSPTHVRVTAGGRIVPNNRGSSSPTTKWTKDKSTCDGTSVHQVPGHVQPEHWGFPFPQPAFGSFPPMYPGFPPGVGPGMPPGPPPYSLMPWHMGMNMGGAFTMPMAPGSQIAGINPSLNKSKDSSRSDKQSESGASDKANATRTSPQEYVDHPRPVFYNGQWMMPPGPQFFHYGMAPPHGFPSPFPAPMMAPQGLATNPTTRPSMTKGTQSMENEVPGRASASTLGVPQPSAAPSCVPRFHHMSSIRGSEITKNHIGILRTRLRYLEDQLQFNKHQIDERSVEKDAQMARQQIQLFEKNLEAQLKMEEKSLEAQMKIEEIYGKADQSNDTNKPAQSNGSIFFQPLNGGAFSMSPMVSDTTAQLANPPSSNQEEKSQVRNLQQKSSGERTQTRFISGLNPTKSVSAFNGWKPLGPENLNGQSSLPVGAALAAPFQPRTDIKVPSLVDSSRRSGTSSGDAGRLNPGNAEYQPAGIPNWEGIPDSYRHATCGPAPYLIGHLPNGIRPDLARDTDYSYDRELTEDELRARHMYWGKAPPHLQKGLPKFNGKDFYPPSPTKGPSSDERSSTALSSHQIHIGTPVFDYGAVPNKSAADPFQSLGDTGHILTRNGPGNSTQSESLPRPEDTLSEDIPSRAKLFQSCATRIGRSLDEVDNAAHESAHVSPVVTKEESSSDEGEEDRELIFTGRRTMSQTSKTHNDLWSSMLKKGKSSAGAVPGTVSSMTAQGVLPHYAGYATAALTPTIANKTASPRRSLAKANDVGDLKVNGAAAERGGENCPPGDSTLADSCRGANI